ncbi:30S ribosome-binding factor RbfA [Patescibacteria group bacterium]|nr:30S ribosome-binding factor RbfA [Patescibacteria group bacterium]
MSKRAEQLAEVIQHEMNNFFIREMEFSQDILVTLTQVKLTPDLKHAYLYLSVLPVTNIGQTLEKVNRNLGRAKHFLSGRLKLRKCPELEVIIDDTLLKDRKVEKVLENLNK